MLKKAANRSETALSFKSNTDRLQRMLALGTEINITQKAYNWDFTGIVGLLLVVVISK